jgi:hypothetical protein
MAVYLIFWEPSAPVVFSAPVASVSMSVVLRWAKKFRVDTDFGGSLTDADVEPGLLDFLAVCEVPLEIWLLRLFTLRKSSSWAADSTEVLFIAKFCSACALTLKTAFSSFSVTVCTCSK